MGLILLLLNVKNIICHEELQPEFINPEIHFTGIFSISEPNSNFTLERYFNQIKNKSLLYMELLTIVELDLHLSDELIQEFFSNSKTNSNKLLDL